MKNPFIYGEVVSGNNYLERPSSEKFISNAIKDNQNIFIVGERRSGKTSTVINVIKSTLKKSYIYADFYGVKTSGEIAKKIINALAAFRVNNFGIEDALKSLVHFRLRAETKPNGSGFEIKPYLKDEEYIEDIEIALKYIHKIAKKKKIVIFFDEFQELKKIKDSKTILAQMRSAIQFISQAAFIFTGSIRSKMDHIFRNPDSPFFKSALPLDFPKIEKDNMYKFVCKKMKKKHIVLPKEIFADLYNITNGIAGDIQQFCKIAFSYLENNSHIDNKLFEKILCELFKLEEKFYNYTLYESSLTKLQVDILVTMAKHLKLGIQTNEFKKIVNNFNSNAINTAIAALEKNNLIYKEGKNLFFFNPFFKEWLKRN